MCIYCGERDSLGRYAWHKDRGARRRRALTVWRELMTRYFLTLPELGLTSLGVKEARMRPRDILRAVAEVLERRRRALAQQSDSH